MSVPSISTRLFLMTAPLEVLAQGSVSRRTFLHRLGTGLALGALPFLTGCGGGKSGGSSGGGTNPPPPPPVKTKRDYFDNAFADVPAGASTPLPVPADGELRSYAVIRGGSFNADSAGSWHTRLLMSSSVDDKVQVGLRKNGYAWNAATDKGTLADYTVNLSAGQSASIDITDSSTGYAMISNAAPTTQITVVHEYRDASGTVVRSLARPAQAKLAASAQFTVLESAKHATGVSLINPGQEAATVTYTLRNKDATSAISATRTLAAGAHLATMLCDMNEFATALTGDYDGTLELSSTKPLAVEATSHGANPMTYLRAHAATQDHATFLAFADAPIQPGASSFLEFLPGGSAATYTVEFFNEDGSRRSVKTDGHGTAHTFTITAEANTLNFLTPSTFNDDGTRQNTAGYVTIRKDNAAARAHLYTDANNQETLEEHVQFTTAKRFHIENDNRASFTLHLVKESEPALVQLYLVNENGEEIATSQNILVNGRTTLDLKTLPGLEATFLTDFKGTLQLASSADIGASATRTDNVQNYRTNLPTAEAATTTGLAQVIIQPYDLSLRKRIDSLPAMDGIAAVTGDGAITINGVQYAWSPAGVSLWTRNGSEITVDDFSHPQYWNDIGIARTNPDTWSTIAVKDANRTMSFNAEANNGNVMEVYLHMMRDIEALNIKIPDGIVPGVDLGTYKKEHFETMVGKLRPRSGFLDRQHIVGIPVNEWGGADGELSLQILKEAVAYQNSLSPLTQIVINEAIPFEGLKGQMRLTASTGPYYGIKTEDLSPSEIRYSIVHIQSTGEEAHRVGAAGSELLSGTTNIDDCMVQYPGGSTYVNLSNTIFGIPIPQIQRNQPFVPIGKLIAGYALNTDRGVIWAK